MSLIVDAFAIRHAQPLTEGEDPGIDPEWAHHAESAGWSMSIYYEDDDVTPEATVFTSPSRRAIETARRLLESEDLEFSQAEPIVSNALAEDAFKDEGDQDTSLRFIAAITDMAKLTVAKTTEGRKPVLVLITHEPTLKRLPHLKNNYSLNTEYASLNEFRVEVS